MNTLFQNTVFLPSSLFFCPSADGFEAKAMTLKIETTKISALHPDPANPRQIGKSELEALTRSIGEFGLVDPIIARRDDKIVIGGHQRLQAARKLGLQTVPVIFLDIDESKARLLNVALNKISGEWDDELLARLLDNLGDQVDPTLTGFDESEIEGLLKTLDAREKKDRTESFDFAEAIENARKAPRTAPGDVWVLGDHRLICGDATYLSAVTELFGNSKASMAFTDPPYGVDYGSHGKSKRRKKMVNDALPHDEWESFCRGWSANLLQSVNGAIYICMSGQEWPTVCRILAEESAHWSTTIIWAKDRFTLGRSDYQREYEPIWYGWRDGAKHHWCGDRDQGDVWQIPRPSDSELHPTMKPLKLVERAIENSSERGDIVLDLFMGSGSTLIACERTGRVSYGIEIDPHYCDIVVARWESFTGEKAEITKAG